MTLSIREQSASHEKGLGYRPALDGIRGLAIALVVAFHTVEFPASGFLGVDLFFVLSGFLITTLLLEEHARTGRISLRAFYRRRLLRLLPALFLLLGVFLALSVASALLRGSPSLDRAFFGVLAGLGYFSNFVLAYKPEGIAMPGELKPLWSLAIEEQFYAVWPLVLVFLLAVRARLALVVLAAGVVLTSAQQVHLYMAGAEWGRIGFGTDTRSVSVLIGCLFAVALVTGVGAWLRSAARWCGPPALVVAGVLVLFNFEKGLFLGPLLLFGMATALVIVHALDSRSLLARALSLPPLVFLGKISYSLYLWHVPVYITLGVGQRVEPLDPLALAIAVWCATMSYYFVELPFLRRKNRRAPAVEESAKPERSESTPLAPASTAATL